MLLFFFFCRSAPCLIDYVKLFKMGSKIQPCMQKHARGHIENTLAPCCTNSANTQIQLVKLFKCIPVVKRVIGLSFFF